jgi:hypothetical protein
LYCNDRKAACKQDCTNPCDLQGFISHRTGY